VKKKKIGKEENLRSGLEQAVELVGGARRNATRPNQAATTVYVGTLSARAMLKRLCRRAKVLQRSLHSYGLENKHQLYIPLPILFGASYVKWYTGLPVDWGRRVVESSMRVVGLGTVATAVPSLRSRVTSHRRIHITDGMKRGLIFNPRIWSGARAELQRQASHHSQLPSKRPDNRLANIRLPPIEDLGVLVPPTKQPIEYSPFPNQDPAHGPFVGDDDNVSRLKLLKAPMRDALPTHTNLPNRSEKDKMMSGKPFLRNNAQLVNERRLALGTLFRFNGEFSLVDSCKQIVTAGWSYSSFDLRVRGRLGSNVHVTAPFYCDYGNNIYIGDNVIIGPDCQFLDSGRIAIGRNTKIGARVVISTLEEPTNAKILQGSESPETVCGVYIGENVYISDGCILKASVRIGNNAIVRTGSVVTQASLCLPRYRNL
jgi:acetyltransferase-like isoleucine patch superfamily enzyme